MNNKRNSNGGAPSFNQNNGIITPNGFVNNNQFANQIEIQNPKGKKY